MNLSIFLCEWEGAERVEAVRRRIECVGEDVGDGGVVGLCGCFGLAGDMAKAVEDQKSGRRTQNGNDKMALYAVNTAARPDYRQPVIPTRA